MEIFLDNTWQSSLVQLFAHYLNLNGSRVKCINLSESALDLVQKDFISFPNIPCMVAGKDSMFRTALSICMKLADIAHCGEIFFVNSNKLQSCQITSWFEQCLTAKNMDDFLENLNNELSDRTFLISSHITFADLAVFSFINDTMAQMEDERKFELCHVFRWFNHIQHMQIIKQFLLQQGKLLASFPLPVKQEAGSDKQAKKDAKKQQKKAGKEEQKEQVETQKPKQEKQEQPKDDKKKEKQDKQQEKKAQVKVEKEQKKEQAKKEPSQQPPAKKETKDAPLEPATLEEYVQLDIRVGKIIEVTRHPDSENLYCEKIDLGGGEIKDIASGLQKFVDITDMSGLCCVAYNLKPRKVANFMSNGMVLCCSTPDKSKIELLRPKDGSVVGERVTLEGLTDKFATEKQKELNSKKKILEKTFLCIKTDADGFATFSGTKWVTSAGFIQSQNIKNGNIS